MVSGWVKEFQIGRTCVKDELRSGRSVIGDALIAILKDHLRKTG